MPLLPSLQKVQRKIQAIFGFVGGPSRYSDPVSFLTSFCVLSSRNPYRKLIPSKEVLFDLPKAFAVVAEEDLSDSHSLLIMNHDQYKIKYTIVDAGTGAGTSSNTNRAARDAVEENNFEDAEQPSDDAAKAAATAGAASSSTASDTTQKREKTQYHTEEWITKLRQALRSTLITVENNTDFELQRSQWDLNRGIWRMIPPEKVAPRQRVQFGTESSGLGFDVGTFGRIIYTTADSDAGGVFTLNWTNTFIFGISHQIGLTSTASDKGELVADMEERKESAAAEVIFRIYQNKAQAEQAAQENADSEEPQSTSDSSAPTHAPAAQRRRVIVQDDGLTCNRTDRFADFRSKYSVAKKKELDRTESRLDILCYQAITYLREHQDVASSFLNFFRDEPEIQFSIEMEKPDGVKVCPVTGYAIAHSTMLPIENSLSLSVSQTPIPCGQGEG